MMMKPFIFADNLQLNTPSEYEYLKKFYQHVEPFLKFVYIVLLRNSNSKKWNVCFILSQK